MTTALERIQARVAARTAAIGDIATPPPDPAGAGPGSVPGSAPPGTDPDAQEDADTESRLSDVESQLAELADRVGQIEQQEVDEVIGDLDGWAEPGMAAALPEPFVAAAPMGDGMGPEGQAPPPELAAHRAANAAAAAGQPGAESDLRNAADSHAAGDPQAAAGHAEAARSKLADARDAATSDESKQKLSDAHDQAAGLTNTPEDEPVMAGAPA